MDLYSPARIAGPIDREEAQTLRLLRLRISVPDDGRLLFIDAPFLQGFQITLETF